MGWTREKLIEDLRNLGVRAGDKLGVHSSMKAIGWVNGGVEEMLSALFDAVGPEGTILMPTMAGPADRFHVAETPSNNGALTEALRLHPDSVRSFHPTHSDAVWGADRQWIADGHLAATGLGIDSPFHRLAQRGGKILLLGVDSTRSSLVHVAEALFGAPYVEPVFCPGYKRTIVMVLPDGREVPVPPKQNPGCSAGFNVVQDELERRGQLITGQVGNATSHLILGEHILTAAMDLLADNPAALLCGSRHCPFCSEAVKYCR